MNSEEQRNARLNMRVSVSARDDLKAAAELAQQDLSAFILGAAMDKAREILMEDRIIHLSPHDVLQFEKALADSGAPSKALSNLFERTRTASNR